LVGAAMCSACLRNPDDHSRDRRQERERQPAARDLKGLQSKERESESAIGWRLGEMQFR
jgi:hypothetical protein